MKLEVEVKTTCLGHVTGDCGGCIYYPKNNPKCKFYAPVVLRTFSVVKASDEENATPEKQARRYFGLFRRVFSYLYHK